MTVSTDRRQGVNSSAAIKVACVASTTANITLSGEQTIDGVAVVDGDRVLVLNQTDASENGIYEVDTSTWTRTEDWNGAYDVTLGTLVFVNGGTQSGYWYVTTTGDITVGTTNVTLTQASTALAAISAYGQTLIDDANAAAARTTLGLGDLATQNDSDNLALSGDITFSGDNTFSGTTNTFSGTIDVSDILVSTGTLTMGGSSSLKIDFDRTDNHGSGATLGIVEFLGVDHLLSPNTYSAMSGVAVTNTAGAMDGAISFTCDLNALKVQAMYLGGTTGGVIVGTSTTSPGGGNLHIDGGLTFDAGTNLLENFVDKTTFTPGITFGGGNTGITYTTQTGSYTRIGDVIIGTGYILLSNKGSSSGQVRISGIPVTAASGNAYDSAVSLSLDVVTFTDQYSGYVVNNSQTIQLHETTNLGVKTVLDDTDFANTSEIYFSFHYHA